MGWRSIVTLVLVAAAIGGATGAAVTLLVRDGADARVRGQLVHLGPPASLYDVDNVPFCVALHHFCIAQTEPGHVVALYTYETHPEFREQGCEVRWKPDMVYPSDSPNPTRGVFADPCAGSIYDMTGHRLFGPAPRDLDTFPVEVTADATIVDTRTLICGNAGPAPASGCKRAPVGD
jgi:Rieske Fe-S protein